MKDEPTIGSPPIPDDRRVAQAESGQLVSDLIGAASRPRDEADRAGGEDLGRDDPDVRLAGDQRPGQFGPSMVTPARRM
jgi:hypothetical protein